ncbi:MAG: hypothetical protein V3V08_00455 [Nannocystaceae bacterium]
MNRLFRRTLLAALISNAATACGPGNEAGAEPANPPAPAAEAPIPAHPTGTNVPTVSPAAAPPTTTDTARPRTKPGLKTATDSARHAKPTAAKTCENGRYKVGESWKLDCNTCVCSEAGMASCTRMACGANLGPTHDKRKMPRASIKPKPS